MKDHCRVWPRHRRLHKPHRRLHAASGPSDDNWRFTLPHELGLNGHQTIPPFLAVYLACFCLMGLPTFPNGPQELERQLFASGSIRTIEFFDAAEIGGFGISLVEKRRDLPRDRERTNGGGMGHEGYLAHQEPFLSH